MSSEKEIYVKISVTHVKKQMSLNTKVDFFVQLHVGNCCLVTSFDLVLDAIAFKHDIYPLLTLDTVTTITKVT